MQTLLVGVDGGATKCAVCIQDEFGNSLAQAISGPANIRLSVEQSWQSIQTAVAHALQSLGLSYSQYVNHLQVGIGLAGCEIGEAYQQFLKQAPSFRKLIVSSDAHTACLGAHQGKEGAVIIVGTGMVGLQIENNHITQVSGWGFPHDDEGSGAWIGLQAIRFTLQWLDGRRPHAALYEAVYHRFKQKQADLIEWANQANSTAFAALAPLVIEQAQSQDAAATHILQQAAQAIDHIHSALLTKQIDHKKYLPCVLTGGIAEFIKPYVNDHLLALLHPSYSSPSMGAILLLKQNEKNPAFFLSNQ
jgi:glucosamine kinase